MGGRVAVLLGKHRVSMDTGLLAEVSSLVFW